MNSRMFRRAGDTIRIICLMGLSTQCAAQGIDSLTREERARRNRIETEAQLRALYGALLRFQRDSNGAAPSLDAACGPLPETCLLSGAGEEPKDFWGAAISYIPKADGFVLRSFGPDGRAGTSDDLVISYPLEQVIVQGIAGCYRPIKDWWRSVPTSVRLDTLPAFPDLRRNYSLHIDLQFEPGGAEWFPIGSDSIAFQWSQGSRLVMLRLRTVGDTLRRGTDFEDLDWGRLLTLVRHRCEM